MRGVRGCIKCCELVLTHGYQVIHQAELATKALLVIPRVVVDGLADVGYMKVFIPEQCSHHREVTCSTCYGQCIVLGLKKDTYGTKMQSR